MIYSLPVAMFALEVRESQGWKIPILVNGGIIAFGGYITLAVFLIVRSKHS